MLWTIAAVLVVLWLLGLVAFHITAWVIHVLIVAAIIVVVYNLVAGRRGTRV
jgi:hypothetical protein